MVATSTTKRLLELKEDVTSSTWFKEHSLVFTDDAQLEEKTHRVLEEEKIEFLRCIDHTSKVSSIILMSGWSLLNSFQPCLFLPSPFSWYRRRIIRVRNGTDKDTH